MFAVSAVFAVSAMCVVSAMTAGFAMFAVTVLPEAPASFALAAASRFQVGAIVIAVAARTCREMRSSPARFPPRGAEPLWTRLGRDIRGSAAQAVTREARVTTLRTLRAFMKLGGSLVVFAP